MAVNQKGEDDGGKPSTWADYLSEDEGVLSEHSIGGYDVALTSSRVLFLKRFPKSFTEVKYDNIHSLEHYTRVNWMELVKALVLIAVASYMYNLWSFQNLNATVKQIILQYLPELSSIVPSYGLIMATIAALFVFGLVNLLGFINSFRGHLRVRRKGFSPIKVQTALTDDVKNLIKAVERQTREEKKTMLEKPAVVAPTPTVSPAPTPAAAEPEAYSRAQIHDKLAKDLEDLKDDAVLLTTFKSQEHADVVASLLDVLVKEKGLSGVYISVSKPYGYLLDAVKSSEIPLDNLFFIDCISHMAGKLPEKAVNTVFIENPSILEEISMYMDKVLPRLKEPKFILLDSVSSMLIYNDQKSVKEFVHYLINYMRLNSIGGAIMSIEKKEADDITRTLSPMVDKEVKL